MRYDPLTIMQAAVIKSLLVGPRETAEIREFLAQHDLRPDVRNLLGRMLCKELVVRTVPETNHKPQVYLATTNGLLRYQNTINHITRLVKPAQG